MDVDVGGAEKLGVRLMGEVEVCAFGELLAEVCKLAGAEEQGGVFNVPELDALLRVPLAAQTQNQVSREREREQQHPHRAVAADDEDDTWNPNHDARHDAPHAIPPAPAKKPPTPINIIELISPPRTHHPSPAGKTSLIHLLTTHAVLPSSLSSVPLNGLTSSIVVFDPLHRFSTSYLASTLLSHIISCFTTAGKDATTPTSRAEVLACVKTALRHVHIFRPVGWDSLVTTLRSLQTYLFDKEKHGSMQRRIHALVFEDVDAFLPGLRAGFADGSASGSGYEKVAAASALLGSLLAQLGMVLDCAVVTTARSATPNAFHPGFALRWPAATTRLTRLAVRRVEIVPFAPGMSVEEAEREREQRGEVVRRGRVEVWRVGGTGQGETGGCVVRVGKGVRVERGER